MTFRMHHGNTRSILRRGLRGLAAGTVAALSSSVVACSLFTSLNDLTGGSHADAAVASQTSAGESAEHDAGEGRLDPTATSTASDAGPTTALDGSVAAPPKSGQPIVSPVGPSPDDAGPACPSGEMACDGVCVDPSSDPANCNGCGNVCSTGLCGTRIAAPMTSVPAGWTFNGSATYNSSAPSAELTKPAVYYQAGSFLYAHPLAVDGLEAKFEFRIGLEGGSRSDGMGFVLEKTGPSAVGGVGGGLGMAALSGFGVELDIFNNTTCGDDSDDHVGIDALTTCPESGDPTSLFETDVSSMVDLGDTHWHSADVTLVAGALSLSIDGTAVITNVTLPGLATGAEYYIGFTGATGGLEADDGGPGGYRQEVKDVTVTFPTPQCL